MKRFFTADTHFNHSNILRYCRRPFADVNEMNETLVENWNSVVGPRDLVYHLGDVGWFPLGSVLERLQGRIVLVQGGHDRPALRHRDRFERVTRFLELTEKETKLARITLCHYVLRVWPRSHHNSWHLFGHSHGRLEPVGKSWDVGVDNNQFRPLELEELAAIMVTRPDNADALTQRRAG